MKQATSVKIILMLIIVLTAGGTLFGQDLSDLSKPADRRSAKKLPPPIQQIKPPEEIKAPKPAEPPVENKKVNTSQPASRKTSYKSEPIKPSVMQAAATVDPKNNPVETKTGVKSQTPSDADKNNAENPKAETAVPMAAGDSIPFMKKRQLDSKEDPGSSSIWLKTIGSVILIVGLLFVGTWIVKKTGIGGIVTQDTEKAPELKILSSVSPKNGQTISVIRFGDRNLLVGSTAQSFTLLADSEEEFETTEEESFDSFEYSGRPVSVSEMLAQETAFEMELKEAGKRIAPEAGGIRL